MSKKVSPVNAEAGTDQSTSEGADDQSPKPLVVAGGVVELVTPPGDAEGGEPAETTADKPPQGDDAQGEGEGESHVVDPEAPWGRKSDGTPRMKPGARKRLEPGVSDEKARQHQRLKSVTQNKAAKPPVGTPQMSVLAIVNHQAMGETAASMWFSGGIMVFGEEWAPDTTAGEHTAVAGAFRDYFKATNMRDLPPGWALVFALSLYTVKRASKPSVQTKFQRIGLWAKENLRILKSKRL